MSAACRRLGRAEPTRGKAQLYSGEAEGLRQHLLDWRCPVVIDTATSAVRFDSFEGRREDRRHLDRFLKRYAVEKTVLEARKKGIRSASTPFKGSIRV